MKIGLLRHYKTDHQYPGRCNSDEYNRDYQDYEKSGIIKNPPPFTGNGYTVCYSSTSRRARETAQTVFNGEIIETPEITEVPLKAIFNTKLRLPLKLWHFINRFGWGFNSPGVPETRNQSRKRALGFLQQVLEAHRDENVLVVSHGFFMMELHYHLRKMGFKSQELIRFQHGGLYEYEKI